MWGLVENEWLKFINSKKFIIFICSLIFMFVYGSFSVYHEANSKRPENLIEENNRLIVILKEKLQSDISTQEKNDINQNIKKLEQKNQVHEKELSNMYNDDKVYINNKIAFLNNQKANPELAADTIQQEEIRSKLEYYNYLLSNDMAPKKEYSISAFEDISKIISTISIILLPILIVFASSDIVSGEYDASTMKMLLAKPRSRSKIIISKFISTVSIIVLLITVVEMITFIILGLSTQFGTANSPIMVGTQYSFSDKGVSAVIGSTYLLPVWKVILLIWLLQIAFIISTVAFASLMSTMFKTTVSSLGISSIIIALISMITFYMPFSFMKGIYPFIFITYSSGLELLLGDLNRNLASGIISIPISLMCMAIWSGLCFVISHRIFVKQDVLI